MEVDGRYSRQELIQGWDQESMEAASVMIVGSGPLAQYVASHMAGLGVGSMYLISNSKIDSALPSEFMTSIPSSGRFLKGASKVELMAFMVEEINTTIDVKAMHTNSLEALVASYEPTVIVDATNQPRSKIKNLDIARKYKRPLISASCGSSYGELISMLPGLEDVDLDWDSFYLSNYEGREQEPAISGVIAGLVSDEVRKNIFTFEGMTYSDAPNPSGNVIRYNLASPTRKGTQDAPRPMMDYYQGFSALVVGAGAVGTYVALALAARGLGRITLVDKDVVEGTNLNRQLLYYRAVGQKKATTLAERLMMVNPNVSARGVEEWYDEGGIELVESGNNGKPFDVVFSCVDSNKARFLINEHCVRAGVPLIEGGCSESSGQVRMYLPGRIPCIDCLFDLANFKEKKTERSFCGQDATPSVVMPNCVIGSLMVSESRPALYPLTSTPIDNYIRYDSLGVGDKIGIQRKERKKNGHEC